MNTENAMNHDQRRLRPLRLLALALALAACGGRDVVAVVGGAKLRQADLAAYRGARGRPPQEALDALIDRTLLAEAGRKAGLEKDPVLRARIRSAEREILAQAYAEKQLAAATEEQALRKRYADEKEKLAHREIHVAQIAVMHDPQDAKGRAAAEAKVSRAAARLAGGEPFEKVAQELSDDRVSAARGGDLGAVREGQVDRAFFEAAVALKRGEVSKPFQSPFGWHLVKALEDPRTAAPPFEEVRGVLAAQARTEGERALLDGLKESTKVKIYPKALERLGTGQVRVGVTP
jgi:parvulin-like peptidyl-prolyl isomerase